MDLQALETQLQGIGNVDYLAPSSTGSNDLAISISGITNKVQADADFMLIATNNILSHYPNMEAKSLDGNTLKAIFTL
jgi:hypothetical protein